MLAQHLLGLACSAPFLPDDVFAEVTTAAPYAELSRGDFDDVLGFVEHGGYALAAYDQWKKLFRDSEGRMHVRNARTAVAQRMNIGTIVEAPVLKVRLVGKRGFGPTLGEVEEYFVNMLAPRRHLHVRRPAAALHPHARDGAASASRAAAATRRSPPMQAAACR